MLYTIMKHIHNLFPTDKRYEGEVCVVGGAISLDFIKDNQYFLVEGSLFNDGVWKYPATGMTDEVFNGHITGLAIPAEFLDLVDEIESYVNDDKRNGFQSESFGGYSYTKAAGANGVMADWPDIFRQRLNVWRKI